MVVIQPQLVGHQTFMWGITCILTFMTYWVIYTFVFLRIMKIRIKKWAKLKGDVYKLETIPQEEWHQTSIRIGYSYQFEGARYTSDKVGIAHLLPFYLQYFKDDELFEGLKKLVDQDKQIDVWVNPKNPSQAIITDKSWHRHEATLYIVTILAWAVLYFAGKHYGFWQAQFLPLITP